MSFFLMFSNFTTNIIPVSQFKICHASDFSFNVLFFNDKRQNYAAPKLANFMASVTTETNRELSCLS